jgi:hypothetical protein
MDYSKMAFRLTVLRVAGETETTQGSIQDWLQLDGDSGFQLLTGKICCRGIFISLSSTPIIILNILFYLFLKLLCPLGTPFASLMRTTPPSN